MIGLSFNLAPCKEKTDAARKRRNASYSQAGSGSLETERQTLLNASTELGLDRKRQL
jgi:hypothetical protein